MIDKKKAIDSSRFNFFTVLEDTISGVIEFILRFVGTTLFSLFRPHKFIQRYHEADVLPADVLPRPYTYLVMSIFVFLKGFYWVSQSPPAEIKTPAEVSYVVKIHELVSKLGDTSTVQIILSVFPSVATILSLSVLISLLHKPFVTPQYRQTTHIFSYVFGAQIVGTLIIFTLFLILSAQAESDFAVGAVVLFFTAGVFCLLISGTLSLRHWFAISVTSKISNLALHLGYTALTIAISFAYFSSIVGAYSELESSETLSIGEGLIIPVNKHKKLILTAYRVEAKNERLTISIFAQNHSDEPYYLHSKASAILVNPPDDDLQLPSSDVALDELHEAYLQEYLKALEVGYSRIELALQKPQSYEKLIRPGKQNSVTYEASISGVIALRSAIGGGYIMIPIANLHKDGSFTYDTVNVGLGKTFQDLHTGLAEEKQKADKIIDEEIKDMQLIFEGLRKDLEKKLHYEQNDK